MKKQFAYRSASKSSYDSPARAVINAIDELTNSIFALNHEAAVLRQVVVSISLLLIWIVLTYVYYSRTDFANAENAFVDAFRAGNLLLVLISAIKMIWTLVVNWTVIRHMAALYIPFWLMEQVAAIYLADIFEKDEKVARTFIDQAAFGGIYPTLHISNGKIANKRSEDSPIIQIGGPGYIIVDPDSAVVVESPDGTARVIKPTSGERHGRALIQGFERIRQCVDLRDVYEKVDITTRSREGIPVTAMDVQYRYCIYRGERPVKSAETPYPFDKNAVLSLVYSATRMVKLDEPSVQKHDWLEPLPGKIIGQIIGEMSSFINKRSLSDFVVGLGKPEDEIFEEHKKESSAHLRAISGQNEDEPQQPDDQNPGLPGQTGGSEPGQTSSPAIPSQYRDYSMEFVPREILTRMFYNSFQDKAAQRGTQLNWIGLGTWSIPDQIILKNHRDAWKLSRENLARSNTDEKQRLFEMAWRQQYISLIEDVPIRKLYAEFQGQEADKQIKGTLKEYLLILENARELYRHGDIPDEISRAITEIERWLYPDIHAVGQ